MYMKSNKKAKSDVGFLNIGRSMPFGGINLSTEISQIADNEAADMLNLQLDSKGSLEKRVGWEKCFASLGPGKIQGMSVYKKTGGVEELLFFHNGKIYKGIETPEKIHEGLNAINRINTFHANGKLYVMDGEHFIYYDGTTFNDLISEVYIPTISVSNTMDGGGEAFEDFNLLGKWFKVHYSPDGNTRILKFINELDTDKVEIKYTDREGDHLLTEGKGQYLISRDDKKLKFDTAPVNLIITYKVYVNVKGDNSKTSFTIPTATATKIKVKYNGESLEEGISDKFTVNSSRNSITFKTAPKDTDDIEIYLECNITCNTEIEYTLLKDVANCKIAEEYSTCSDTTITEKEILVDREKKSITFVLKPEKGINTIELKAAIKLTSEETTKKHNMILKCSNAFLFGGSNDSRVFLYGNPEFPNRLFRSGVTDKGLDPSYFPENAFQNVGPDNEKIQGLKRQYDTAVIIKEHSIEHMAYEMGADGGFFPTRPLNGEVGCIATGSIQLVENNPIFLSNRGVYMLTQSNVRDERNVTMISLRVNKKLLTEDLINAISEDYERRYILSFPNGRAYVYDYYNEAWYIWDNINASCFIEYKGKLYFGTEGTICRFKEPGNTKNYNDDGIAINSYWQSKLFDFGVPYMTKLVEKVFFNLKPNVHTSTKLTFRTDRKEYNFALEHRLDQVNFWNMDFSKFGFITSQLPQEIATKVKAKKITYLQLTFTNNEIDEPMALLNIDLKYRMQTEKKR